MNKIELTKLIKKNAKEQIKIYEREIKEYGENKELRGAIRGILMFLINLKAIRVIS